MKYFLVAITLLLTIHLSAQLKEFTISEMPRPDVAVVQANAQFSDDALLLIYSTIEGLEMRSSLGAIDKVSYNPSATRYEVLVKPLKQMIFVAKAGFIEAKVATINPNAKDVYYYKVEEKAADLSKLKGKLGLQSNPIGCDIFINDLQLVNKTPFTHEIQVGMNKITLKKERYLELDTLLEVKADQTNNFTLTLKPAWADLEINSNPSNASISLNKERKVFGNAIFKGSENGLPAGAYTINVEAPKYRPMEKRIFLAAGQNEKLQVDLEPMLGEIQVFSKPENVEVYLNGKYAGTSPYKQNLEIGSYDLELKKRGHKEERYSIALKDGEQKVINATLRNYSVVMRPIKIKKTLFACLSIGSALAGAYYLYDANTSYNAYKTAIATSEADALRARVQFGDRLYPVFFGAAALSLIPTIRSAKKLKRLKKEWSLAALPVGHGAGMVFTLKM
jgi:hypothetical protein